MRHFLNLGRGLSPPLLVPRLACRVPSTPTPTLLIPPACRAHPLLARLLRADPTAVALSAIT